MRAGRRLARVLAAVVLAATAAACDQPGLATPACGADTTLGLVAQSVPGAAYLPCVEDLPEGWSLAGFEASSGGARFDLHSDRAGEPVRVRLVSACDVDAAFAVPPRAEGVRTYLRLSSTSPTYAGELVDVFAGGCVTYHFAFDRGPHIALMDELGRAVQLYPRRELRLELRSRLGVDVDRVAS